MQHRDDALEHDMTIDLGEVFQEALDACHQQGMQLPFIICALAVNGSVFCIRAHGFGAEPDVLAEHYEEALFALPITMVVVDRTGKAAHISIEASDPKRLVFH